MRRMRRKKYKSPLLTDPERRRACLSYVVTKKEEGDLEEVGVFVRLIGERSCMQEERRNVLAQEKHTGTGLEGKFKRIEVMARILTRAVEEEKVHPDHEDEGYGDNVVSISTVEHTLKQLILRHVARIPPYDTWPIWGS